MPLEKLTRPRVIEALNLLGQKRFYLRVRFEGRLNARQGWILIRVSSRRLLLLKNAVSVAISCKPVCGHCASAFRSSQSLAAARLNHMPSFPHYGAHEVFFNF